MRAGSPPDDVGRLYDAAMLIGRPTFRFLWQIRTVGLDHVPASGPAILAPNHTSVIDSFLLPVALRRRITFVGNIGYGPGSIGPTRRGTERVLIRYTDGHERLVNLVIGKVRGYDGKAEREFAVRKLSVVDFDEARIAPALYKACERGHVWEQEQYRYCPFDGLALESYRVDTFRR